MSKEIRTIKSTFQILEAYSVGGLGIGVAEQIFALNEEFDLEIRYDPLEFGEKLKTDEAYIVMRIKDDTLAYRSMLIKNKDGETFKASDVLYKKVYGVKVLEPNAPGAVIGTVEMWLKGDIIEPDPPTEEIPMYKCCKCHIRKCCHCHYKPKRTRPPFNPN